MPEGRTGGRPVFARPALPAWLPREDASTRPLAGRRSRPTAAASPLLQSEDRRLAGEAFQGPDRPLGAAAGKATSQPERDRAHFKPPSLPRSPLAPRAPRHRQPRSGKLSNPSARSFSRAEQTGAKPRPSQAQVVAQERQLCSVTSCARRGRGGGSEPGHAAPSSRRAPGERAPVREGWPPAAAPTLLLCSALLAAAQGRHRCSGAGRTHGRVGADAGIAAALSQFGAFSHLIGSMLKYTHRYTCTHMCIQALTCMHVCTHTHALHLFLSEFFHHFLLSFLMKTVTCNSN